MTGAPATKHHPARVRRGKVWNLALAIFFLALGIVGILIPVMPQFLFFAMSLFFFSMVFPPVRRALRRFMHRRPKLLHRYNAWRHRRREKRRKRIQQARAMAEKLHLGHSVHPTSPRDAGDRKVSR